MVLINNLGLYGIQDDFSMTFDAPTGTPAWVTTGLSVGATVAGMFPGAGPAVSASLTMFSSALDATADPDAETTAPVDANVMLKALAAFFESMAAGLVSTQAGSAAAPPM